MRFVAIVLLLGVWVSAADADQAQDAILKRRGWIRLIVQRDCNSIDVTVAGPVRLGEKNLSAGGSFRAEVVGAKVRLSRGTEPVAESDTLTIQPTSSTEPFLKTARGVFRGRLVLSANGSTFKVVNELQIDEWIMGVLPAEIGDAPLEALKAQAITARSEALHKLVRAPHTSEGYDFCTGVHCQAYKGAGEETALSRKAALETVGMVLTANGQVVDAVYHNTCGGVTAGAEDVWDSPPIAGLTPVFDEPSSRRVEDLGSEAAFRSFIDSPAPAYCSAEIGTYPSYAKKYWRWTKRFSAAQLERLVRQGTIRDVRVTERRRSGRVRKLEILCDRDTRTIEKELPIRNMFDLWSGLFYVDVERAGGAIQAITFKGAGSGHGVGLCQMGAITMGTRGMTYDQILAHYYPGTKIWKAYRP